MYILYADESGSTADNSQEHFILAGVSVFEHQTHWLSLELDEIAKRFNPSAPDTVELHGSPMLTGKKFWRQFPKEERTQAIIDALELIDGKHYKIFASVVHKEFISPKDSMKSTFEQLITRFDHFLSRERTYFNNNQRGIVIFDKSNKEAPIQKLAHEFQHIGHESGTLKNMSEVPVFVDSEMTRLIQLADLVAYGLFRYFEKDDDRFYSVIEKKFDFFRGTQHGLHLEILPKHTHNNKSQESPEST